MVGLASQLPSHVTSAITLPERSPAATRTSWNIAQDSTNSMSPYARAFPTTIQQPFQADQLDRGEDPRPTSSWGQMLSLGPLARSVVRLPPTLADRFPNLGRLSKMLHDPGSRARPPLVLELLIMRFTTQHIAQREDWFWWPLLPVATRLDSSTCQVLSDARAVITSIRQSLQADQLNQAECGRLMGQLGRMLSL